MLSSSKSSRSYFARFVVDTRGLCWGGMGWDGLGGYRYLGCTAFSDWEHRVVVAEARGVDWTGLLDVLDVRGY